MRINNLNSEVMNKRILFLLPLLLIFLTGFAQTLNQSASWPNANWTLTGSYTAGALLTNPTTSGTQFQFDDEAVNSGADDNSIAAESPVINLKPAFDNGEKAIRIAFQLSFKLQNPQVLKAQYFDADANGGTGAWTDIPGESSAPEDTSSDNYKTCTLGPDPDAVIVMNIASLTTNQLQNFRYRLLYDDMSSSGFGFCIYSPTITSFNCTASSGISAMNIGAHSAEISWTSTNNNVDNNLEWVIEYGLQGYAFGTAAGTRVMQVNSSNYFIQNLTPNTAYDFYVQDDCSGGGGLITSGWTGPFTFSTSVLSLEENTIEGFSWFPNPINDKIELKAEQKIDHVIVYDILGQKVLEEKPNTLSSTLNMSLKSQGWYFLKIRIADKTGVYKIYKE